MYWFQKRIQNMNTQNNCRASVHLLFLQLSWLQRVSITRRNSPINKNGLWLQNEKLLKITVNFNSYFDRFSFCKCRDSSDNIRYEGVPNNVASWNYLRPKSKPN